MVPKAVGGRSGFTATAVAAAAAAAAAEAFSA